MTAQIAETLRLDGENHAMCVTPLDDFFALGGIDPGFESNCTALWRGYVGSWEIADERLYLVALRGTLQNGAEASLATVFPGYPARVFAHWYCGTIRIPQGRLLEYVHMGYGSTYERDVLIEVERGVVTGRRTRHNGTANPDETSDGYRVAAMTVFPRNRNGGGDER